MFRSGKVILVKNESLLFETLENKAIRFQGSVHTNFSSDDRRRTCSPSFNQFSSES